MTKARITYRFDQEKEKFDRQQTNEAGQPKGTSSESVAGNYGHVMEEDKIYDSQMLNQFTTDYGAWSSPFDIETERLEKLIRESNDDHGDDSTSPSNRRGEIHDGFSHWTEEQDKQVHARDDGPIIEEDDHDAPIIIEDDLGKSTRTAYSAFTYRSGRTPWFRIITSVTGAIATGVLLGLFVMQMFANLALSPEAPPAPTVQNPGDETNLPPADEASSGLSEGVIAVQVPEQTVYMLQYGVFSTLDGARAAQDQLREAGIASAYEAGEQHAVYAGLTPDRNSALLLSNQLDNMSLETYVKAFERPAVTELRWGEAESEQVEAYFRQGIKLAQTVALLTLVHLEETQLTNFEDATIQALTASHQEWTVSANRIAGEVPESGRESFEQMNNEITTAVNSLFEYKKNPSTAYLWQAQTAVMNYVIMERSLLRALAV